MEYCNFGSLHQRVFSIPIDELNIWEIIKQLANAIAYLHSKNIIHGDIKPLNVLLSKDENQTMTLKLADFGSSYDKSEMGIDEFKAEHFIGTEIYTPPEVLRNETFDKPADIWSFGATIAFVCNRGHLFLTKQGIRSWTGKKSPINSLGSSRYSKDLHLLVMGMLQPDPKKRPTAEVILIIASNKYSVSKSNDVSLNKV